MNAEELSRSALKLELATAPTEDVRMLVEELEAELGQNYPPEQRHGLKLDAIFQPYIRFFVAYVEGKAVGCGGIALFPDFGEIKRMYVRPAARGRGVAEAIMCALEHTAREGGLELVRLETGTEQDSAIRFYTRHGFAPCDAFEPYASMPPEKTCASLFYEKRLDRPA